MLRLGNGIKELPRWRPPCGGERSQGSACQRLHRRPCVVLEVEDWIVIMQNLSKPGRIAKEERVAQRRLAHGATLSQRAASRARGLKRTPSAWALASRPARGSRRSDRLLTVFSRSIARPPSRRGDPGRRRCIRPRGAEVRPWERAASRWGAPLHEKKRCPSGLLAAPRVPRRSPRPVFQEQPSTREVPQRRRPVAVKVARGQGRGLLARAGFAGHHRQKDDGGRGPGRSVQGGHVARGGQRWVPRCSPARMPRVETAYNRAASGTPPATASTKSVRARRTTASSSSARGCARHCARGRRGSESDIRASLGGHEMKRPALGSAPI